MGLSDTEIRRYSLHLLRAKNTISAKYAFFSYLISRLGFALDEECETACTDGETLFFGPSFLEKLDDDETVFLMLHELMHCVLRHTSRTGSRNAFLFNVAADIVSNSILLETFAPAGSGAGFTVAGETPMHIAPDGSEGREHTTEEVYQMLLKDPEMKKAGGNLLSPSGEDGDGGYTLLDDHSLWGKGENSKASDDEWSRRIIEAAAHAKTCGQDGHIPTYIRQMIDRFNSREVDWKTALHNFCRRIDFFDYSWMRGDRRYTQQDLYLPDYTETDSDELEASDLLFFVDTSGSMSDEEVGMLMAEIRSAISIFNNRLKGKLGFFDTQVIEPVEFDDEQSFKMIEAKGGGGTDFKCIFKYIDKNEKKPPAAIIIMTDGFAPFPDEKIAKGVPVLWIIYKTKVKPPWGEVITIK